MKILQEFKKFAVRGNVMDMAVGVVIGTAFGKIVSSLVEDIILPPFVWLSGGSGFGNLFVAFDGQRYESLEAAKAATSVWAYGSFMQTIFDFVVIAAAIFAMIKLINMWRDKAEKVENAKMTKEQELLTEIRDALIQK